MVRYIVHPRRRAAVLDGSNPLTIRAAGGKRHARLAEEVHILEGQPGPVFARATCAFRATLVLSKAGLHAVLAPSFTDAGQGLANLCWAAVTGAPHDAEHRDKLARFDGFADWADLTAYHVTKAKMDDEGRVRREVIGWAGAEGV